MLDNSLDSVLEIKSVVPTHFFSKHLIIIETVNIVLVSELVSSDVNVAFIWPSVEKKQSRLHSDSVVSAKS